VRLWPTGGLWRHPDFLKLWSAETVSQFGSQISGLAIPLVAIIVLKASAFEVAALTVIEFAPFLLFSLPAGVWVDRLRRRPILVIADLARAALLFSIPIAYAFDVLTLGQLFVTGFLFGIFTVFFDVAYQSYLPSLVDRTQLIDGNSKLEISRAGAQLGGPGVGGLLVGKLNGPVAIMIDAVSFVFSAVFLFSIRKVEPKTAHQEGERGPGMKAEIREGLRYVLRHRYLRYIAACTATFNFFGSFIGAILLVYAVRSLHLSPELIGLALTLSNFGPLLGAFTANKISGRLGVGPTIIASSAIAGPMFLLVPLAPQNNIAVIYLTVCFAIGGFANVVYNITQVSFRQAITPERIQGRMNSVMRFIVWGTIPLGQLAGGALATGYGLRSSMWIGAIGCCLPFLPVLLSPVRSLREMPEPLAAEPEEEALLEPVLVDAAAVTVQHPGT
jgi:MFS family permease